MNGWIISTIVLAVILFVELVCFLTHKVKKHNRKKYKTYLNQKERDIINKWLQKYPEDYVPYVPEYVSRDEHEQIISDLQCQIDLLQNKVSDIEYTLEDMYDEVYSVS